MDLEKAYNKWQCTDIEEKYINNIEPTQFTKSELFSFAEFYHQSKVNNCVLDDVKECLHPFNKVVSGDEGDFCTECQKYLKTNWL